MGYTNILRHPVWGHIKVHIFIQPISDEHTKSIGIKNEFKPRAVVRLVSIFNCLADDWTMKDKWKVTWQTIKCDVVRVNVSPEKRKKNDVQLVFTLSCLWEGSCLIYVIRVCLCIVVSNTSCVVFFVLFVFVLCVRYCQFLWIVHSWLPFRFSLTFIDSTHLTLIRLLSSMILLVLAKK